MHGSGLGGDLLAQLGAFDLAIWRSGSALKAYLRRCCYCGSVCVLFCDKRNIPSAVPLQYCVIFIPGQL